MPAPSSYSEGALAEFAIIELGPTADVLGWAPSSPAVAEAVSDVELALGIADVADSPNVAGLRALARLYVWRRADAALAVQVDTVFDNESVKWSQMHKHATDMVSAAAAECSALGVGGAGGSGVVTIHGITRSEDPYGVQAAAGDGF